MTSQGHAPGEHMAQYELTLFRTETDPTAVLRGYRVLADAIREGQTHADREWEVTDEDERVVWRHRRPQAGLGEYLAEFTGVGFDGALEKSTP